jgi:hypothetical protein
MPGKHGKQGRLGGRQGKTPANSVEFGKNGKLKEYGKDQGGQNEQERYSKNA